MPPLPPSHQVTAFCIVEEDEDVDCLVDFRVIPMSDIDLQYEHKIHLVNETGVTRASVRRVYSAKLDGRTSAMTVAVYQGDGAEEVRHILYS